MRHDGELVIGTVIMSMPEYGMAKVETSGGTNNIKSPMMCYLPYSDATCGALLQTHIQDGSSVVCMRSLDRPDFGFILCAVNAVNADMSDTLNGRQFYNTNKMTTRKTTIFDTMIDSLKDFIGGAFHNHANSVDKDVLPGDVDIVNHGGSAGLHVGRYLTQLRGSPVAFIDVAGIKNQIRMVAATVSTHTDTTFQQTGDISVDDNALDAAEAFGLPAGTDVLESVDKLDDTVAFFRQQEVKGAAADGQEKIIVAFPDAELHTDTTEPPVLSRQREALSGELSSLSAHSVSIGKTAGIPAILQYGYDKVNKDDAEVKQMELLTPYEYEKPKQGSAADSSEQEETPAHTLNQEIMDAAINQLTEKILSGDYIETLKQKLAEQGLYIAQKPLNQQFKWNDSDGKTAGPVEQQQYDIPRWLTLTDPATGRTHVYFDSSAFMRFTEDGSILFVDGYGSEIRMSQGNIYISPALDLIQRPGRDMSAMVPRHLSLNTQGYVVINSTKAVYLRSTGDMQLAAATEGKGRLSLECDDPRNTDSTGIVIKSLGNAAFTGHNLYVGINKGTSDSEGRIEQTEQPGTLIIDAGNKGAIIERGRSHLVDTELFTVVTTGTVNTAFSVGSGIIGLYAEAVVAPAQFQISPMDGVQIVKVVRDGREREIIIDTNSNPFIMMRGDMEMTGSLSVGKSIRALADVISRRSLYVTNSNILDDKTLTFIPVDVPANKLNGNIEKGSGSAYAQAAAQTFYQDAYIANNSFSFPEHYDIAELKVPGMVWQEATRELVGDVSQVAWQEKPFISVTGTTTACYPGWDIWQSAKITQTGYKEADLISNYITNTTKEN